MPITCVPWPSPSCGVRVALHLVAAGPDAPRQVRVVGLHAGVDHRHHRAGAGRDAARAVGLDQVEVPLLAAARVGGRRGPGTGQQDEKGENEGPAHGA